MRVNGKPLFTKKARFGSCAKRLARLRSMVLSGSTDIRRSCGTATQSPRFSGRVSK